MRTLEKDYFSTVAADYGRFRPRYPPQLAEQLARVSPARRMAWDVGCGTGQLSVLLATQFDHVRATDMSPEQVANAERHPRIQYEARDASSSGLPTGSADLVVAAQAAHWFALDAFYAEARRVLVPDGVVALVTYGVLAVEGAPDSAVQDFYAGTLGPYWPADRKHVETKYRLLPFPFEELAVPAVHMTARWTLDEFLGYVGTWSAVGRARTALGEDFLRRFGAVLAQSWGERPRTIRWPISVRAGKVGRLA
jgi:SAM-dependent methyltransferase